MIRDGIWRRNVYLMKAIFDKIYLKICLGIVIILLSLSAPAHAQNLFGLVIGIDDYLGESNDLAGAVNDANDIHDSLLATGAVRVERFLDGEATKENIKRAWLNLVNEAKEGDTIVFSYSGHGSQEDEPLGRNGEEDGKNENFLLANYQPSGENTKERIVDDELFVWIKAADDRGIQVILIADSCHSGTMHRSAGNQKIRYRTGEFPSLQEDQLRYPGKEAATLSENDLNYFTFLGATSDHRLTPEIQIDRKWRGALSWSFARALEGLADTNRDGQVSQLELLGYVIPSVKTFVENQQSPQMRPIRAESRPLFYVNRNTGIADDDRPSSSLIVGGKRKVYFDVLRVFVDGDASDVIRRIKGITLVSKAQDADIIWNVARRTVEHTVGGRVAENVTSQSVRAVISKWAAVKYLKGQMIRSPVNAKLLKGGQRYRRNQLVEIEVDNIKYPYLTLFNLPPDGKVEFFLPAPNRPADATRDWTNGKYQQKFRVSNPPYGAEHLVSIYSDQVLNGLHAALQTMKRPKDAEALRTVLEQALKSRKYQVGVLGIYTGD